uniref:Serine aminopeptidase S33 domain-containing protein n=1 Tax=Kalanchoe fedtschenkoi TaxID=63787 RepID=A0A7N1A1F4_KALFE
MQADGSVKYDEEYILNPQGQRLFTCRWLPVEREPKALVFLCHGYALESSTCMKGAGTRLATAGYAAYSMDYKGHGKSCGLLGYIDSFDDIVTDYLHYVTSIVDKSENKGRKKFLLGESAGGALALLIHGRQSEYWDGAILAAPMCKIAEEVTPNAMVVWVIKMLANIIPTWGIVPIPQDLVEASFRDPRIRENPNCYKGRPRLKTALELVRAGLEVEQGLPQVSLPFLVVHGGGDIVTDISASKMLFEIAGSTDKSLKMYPGMWHSLIYGEMPENLDIVFADIIAWLDERTAPIIPASLEVEIS